MPFLVFGILAWLLFGMVLSDTIMGEVAKARIRRERQRLANELLDRVRRGGV
jgi:hypothetical protein